MPLPIGTWKAIVNGAETILRIDAPDQQGVFTGQIFGGRIKGFWSEPAQKIEFASYAEGGAGNPSPLFGIFEGYLFRTPMNPPRSRHDRHLGWLAASKRPSSRSRRHSGCRSNSSSLRLWLACGTRRSSVDGSFGVTQLPIKSEA